MFYGNFKVVSNLNEQQEQNHVSKLHWSLKNQLDNENNVEM